MAEEIKDLCGSDVEQGYAVMIEVQDPETGEYVVPAAQKGGTLNRSAETIDISSKDDYGWSSSIQGMKSWSMDLDGLFITSHKGLRLLEDAWYNGDCVRVRLRFPDGTIYIGLAIITDFPIEAPFEDTVTYSMTLQGKGMLNRDMVAPFIRPTSVTIAPEAPTVAVGAEVALTATVLPEGASQNVLWSSDNEAVATVSVDGKVTGVAEGEAGIHAKPVGSAVVTTKATVKVTTP